MTVWVGASLGATNTKAGGGNTKTFHLGMMAKRFTFYKGLAAMSTEFSFKDYCRCLLGGVCRARAHHPHG
jgi:hypothetical protein